MQVMTLDLSRHTGWALWRPGQSPTYGTATFLHGFRHGRLGLAFDKWLCETLGRRLCFAGSAIFYEEPIIPRGKSTRVETLEILNGLAWHVEFRAREYRVDAHPVNNWDWRGHFLGRRGGRRAELKAATIAECRARGFRPGTDDAADALGILDYAAHELGIAPDWPRSALEGVCGMNTREQKHILIVGSAIAGGALGFLAAAGFLAALWFHGLAHDLGWFL